MNKNTMEPITIKENDKLINCIKFIIDGEEYIHTLKDSKKFFKTKKYWDETTEYFEDKIKKYKINSIEKRLNISYLNEMKEISNNW